MERFAKEDVETKKKILGVIDTLKKPDFNGSLIEVAENKDENAEIRLQALSILKDTGTMELEGRLNNIYYNDPATEMKEAAKHTLEFIKNREKNK